MHSETFCDFPVVLFVRSKISSTFVGGRSKGGQAPTGSTKGFLTHPVHIVVGDVQLQIKINACEQNALHSGKAIHHFIKILEMEGRKSRHSMLNLGPHALCILQELLDSMRQSTRGILNLQY